MRSPRRRAVRTGAAPSEAEIEKALGVPGAGHNRPPAASLDLETDQWIAWLDHVFEEATRRRDERLESFERFRAGYPTIDDDDVAGRAGDLRDKLVFVTKSAKNLHEQEKLPVLRAQRAIDGYLRRFLAPIEERDSKGKLVPGSKAALNVIQARLDAYGLRQLEASKKAAAEEALRKQREAQQATQEALTTMSPEALAAAATAAREAEEATAHAAAKPADHTRVHGPMGSTTSLKGPWQFKREQSDLMALVRAVAEGKAPLAYLDFNERTIGAAIRNNGVRDIPGCVIEQDLHMR